MEDLYIKLLCKKIEERYGQPIETTEDFERLSNDIRDVTKERLSVSTLKRAFGRVASSRRRRDTTLNILAQYIGFRDWKDYLFILKSSIGEESDFKAINAIAIDRLAIGEQLKISWLPNREIYVEYLGDKKFIIRKAVNTKLLQGDTIEIELLAPGEPMFISRITRNERFFTGYLAGQLHGVNVEHCNAENDAESPED